MRRKQFILQYHEGKMLPVHVLKPASESLITVSFYHLGALSYFIQRNATYTLADYSTILYHSMIRAFPLRGAFQVSSEKEFFVSEGRGDLKTLIRDGVWLGGGRKSFYWRILLLPKNLTNFKIFFL